MSSLLLLIHFFINYVKINPLFWMEVPCHKYNRQLIMFFIYHYHNIFYSFKTLKYMLGYLIGIHNYERILSCRNKNVWNRSQQSCWSLYYLPSSDLPSILQWSEVSYSGYHCFWCFSFRSFYGQCHFCINGVKIRMNKKSPLYTIGKAGGILKGRICILPFLFTILLSDSF